LENDAAALARARCVGCYGDQPRHAFAMVAAILSRVLTSAAKEKQVMKKWYVIALLGFAFGTSPHAFAEVVNLTNSAEGKDKDTGIAAVKEKLNAACNPESFEVVFEKTNPNPDVPKPYYVDAKMKCDLP
jgi:hypothetical protein